MAPGEGGAGEFLMEIRLPLLHERSCSAVSFVHIVGRLIFELNHVPRSSHRRITESLTDRASDGFLRVPCP
jgi:hypothetical protein